jgi:hypothetical protein
MAEYGNSMIAAWSSGTWSEHLVSVSTPAAMVIVNNNKRYTVHVILEKFDAVMQ